MSDKEYFSHLYEIASHLNQAFSLQVALQKALERTVSLLQLETGWVWLVQKDNQSVYLAASYKLPAALANYPERLSGYCYCIHKYLTDDFPEARNISEITCTRLKDIRVDTPNLKFHATVPIFVKGEKAGLLNLVSKETQQLDEKQLAILNTISELIGIAIERTRLQETFVVHQGSQKNGLHEILERILQPRLETLLSQLNGLREMMGRTDEEVIQAQISQTIELAGEMHRQLSLIHRENQRELTDRSADKHVDTAIRYPASPLTGRELEVLHLVKKGFTNKQIAEQLFITERTVKFHLSSILSKLHAETRTAAVDTALRRGLLSLS